MNRIDEVIVFHKLRQEDLKQITDIMLNKVIDRIKNQNIDLVITENVRDMITSKGTDYKYGARPLRRTIQNLVEDKITDKILSGELGEDNKIVLDVLEGKVVTK